MAEERTTPLRQRMIEDMCIRGMGDKAQKAHIRAIRDFPAGRYMQVRIGPRHHAAARIGKPSPWTVDDQGARTIRV